MNKQNMKNMIVLKDLPSNIIDEAIVILKPNVKLREFSFKDNKKIDNKQKENAKNYIVNEAQMVISYYLKSIEKNKRNEFISNIKIKKKYNYLKAFSIIICFAFIISLIL